MMKPTVPPLDPDLFPAAADVEMLAREEMEHYVSRIFDGQEGDDDEPRSL